jgi:Domain of unknown function (DUF4439)
MSPTCRRRGGANEQRIRIHFSPAGWHPAASDRGTAERAGSRAGGKARPMSSASGSISSRPAGTPQPVIAALQSALAAEQAASYGYGVVGALLPQGSAQQATASTDWVAHMRARDKLSALITARGATPVPAAVAYKLPGPVRTAAQARALATTLEDRVAEAYLALVALPERSLRRLGAEQVRAAALRAQAWRGTVQAFPGLPGEPGAS